LVISDVENVEQLAFSDCWGECKMCNHFGTGFIRFFKNPNISTSDLAIPNTGILPKRDESICPYKDLYVYSYQLYLQRVRN
jgi:hypothetical protein